MRLVALSGGVDSSVVAVQAYQANSDQLRIVFIDTGLMREGEPQWVQDTFRDLGIEIEIINAADRFFSAFEELDEDDPDKGMRPIFSKTFYEVLGELECDVLLQGTNRADIEETRSRIKLQHNVDIDPLKYGFKKIVEPLKIFYKHEIRQLAKELDLPDEIVYRQPFPGPGLGIRCYLPINFARIAIVRKATAIVEKIIEKDYIEFASPFQYFPVLVGDKACGIRDGKRVWGNIIVIRCVDSADAISAQNSGVPEFTKRQIYNQIIEDIPSVTRVLYDLTDKPPGTIEFL